MALNLQSSFKVALPVQEAWALLQQLDVMAGCFPGGALTEWDGTDDFVGEVVTRLGPMTMSFKGKGTIVERDPDKFRMRIRGEGAEQKGRGRAQADFEFTLSETSPRQTDVVCRADVTLLGSIAQYGRGAGMIQALANELTRQFASNVELVVQGDGEAPPPSGSLSVARLAGRAIIGKFRRSEGAA